MSNTTVPLERHVRSRDPETSWEAAQQISGHEWPDLLRQVLSIVADIGPATDDEIYREYIDREYPWRTPQRLRTARHDLTLGTSHNFGTVTTFRPALAASKRTGRSKLGNRAKKWDLA